MANPITIADVQQHLRLGTLDAGEQAELEMMIESATELAESFCNREWRSGDSSALFDFFPTASSIPLTVNADIQAISGISYYNGSHEMTSFTSFRYVNIAGRSKIYPAFDATWPTDCNNLPFNIIVDLTVGDELNVPSSVKSAILLIVGDLYENRENTVIDQGISSVSLSVTAERLLTPYKTRLA